MRDTNIVYLTYGRESEHQRALFSILSFFSWSADNVQHIRIIIYTDKPDFFEPYLRGFNIEYFILTPELLEAMLAGTGYIHRRKVAVVDMTFRKYPEANIVFIDSDTFFIARPESILKSLERGKSLMHKREYTIEDGLSLFKLFDQAAHPQAFVDYIAKKTFYIAGEEHKFTGLDYCWNSGVIGLHKDFFPLMSDVYTMTDRFYANSEWFISEQLAFSFVVQRKTKVEATEAYIIHYWGKRQKVLLDGLLAKLFKANSISKFTDKKYLRAIACDLNNAIDKDLMIEQAVISIASKAWYSSFKNIVKIILKSPFQFALYKQIRDELKSGMH